MFVKLSPVKAASVLAASVLMTMIPAAQADQPPKLETHRFNVSDCGFSLRVDVARWERQLRPIDTYGAAATKSLPENGRVYVQAIAKRKSLLTDPAAELFDGQHCMVREVGQDTTGSGNRIRLQALECAQSSVSGDGRSPGGQYRLYGTVHGHWSSLGAGLFAPSEADLVRYKPAFMQILRTFRHQCPMEFLPLPTGEAAQAESRKLSDHAIEKAIAAASATAAAKHQAKREPDATTALNDLPLPPSKRRPVTGAREWHQVVGNECKYAFQVEQGKWGPDTFDGTEALIPIVARSKFRIYLTTAHYFIDDDDNGVWAATAPRKCVVERRGTLRTSDGRPAPLFLASNCQRDSGFHANLNRTHLLYSYVRKGQNSADYFVLASDDKRFLMAHEGEMIAIVESHTNQLPSCLNYRK